MADFPTDPVPDYPIQETPVEPEILISKHKDGSEQRRFKGAGRKRTFRLGFGTSMPLTNTQRVAIANHYAGQNGKLTAFQWTHTERGEIILVRYADTPAFRHVGFNAYEGEVRFEEVPA